MPTSIRERGFFSDEAQAEAAKIKEEYKQLFFRHRDLSRLVHIYRSGLELTPANGRLVLGAALLARALTAFEAMVFLTEKGFGSEARSSCRNIIDVLFKLAYLSKEPSAAGLLIKDSERYRHKRLQKMKEGKAPLIDELSAEKLETLIAEAKAKAAKFPTNEDVAEKCGLEREYYGLYNLLSEATHSGARELENYIEFDAENNVVGYRFGPELPSRGLMIEITIQGAAYLLNCVECVTQIFNFENPSAAANLLRKMDEIFSEMVERYKDLGAVLAKLNLSLDSNSPGDDLRTSGR